MFHEVAPFESGIPDPNFDWIDWAEMGDVNRTRDPIETIDGISYFEVMFSGYFTE